MKYGIASIALQEDWIKEKLNNENCLFQSALFENEDFNRIKQKGSIELEVGDNDLDLDEIKPQDMNITGIPSHVALLASQRSVILQQREMMENHKKIPDLIKQAIEECGISSGKEFRSVIAELQEISSNLVR